MATTGAGPGEMSLCFFKVSMVQVLLCLESWKCKGRNGKITPALNPSAMCSEMGWMRHFVTMKSHFGKAEVDKLSAEAASALCRRWAYSVGGLSDSFLEYLPSRILSGALAFLPHNNHSLLWWILLKYNLHKWNCCNPVWIETHNVVRWKEIAVFFFKAKFLRFLTAFGKKKGGVCGVKIFDGEWNKSEL